MRIDKQNENTITQGVAEMDINEEVCNNGECCRQDCKCAKTEKFGCKSGSTPVRFAMCGPSGPWVGRGRRRCWGPPSLGPYAPMEGKPPFGPPQSMQGPPPFGPPQMDDFYGCPPWMNGMPSNMGYGPSGFMGQPGFMGSFPGARRGMGRCMRWKRWARKMAEKNGNESQKCEEGKPKDDAKALSDQNENSGVSGSEDEGSCPPCMSFMGPPGLMGQSGFHCSGKHRRMGRCKRWKKFGRKTAGNNCCDETCNKSQKCVKSKDEDQSVCEKEIEEPTASGSDDEATNPPWMNGTPAMGPPGFFQPGFMGPSGFAGHFQFPHMHRGMGRRMRWRRWARMMAANDCYDAQNEQQQHIESNSSGSEDEEQTTNSGVSQFEESLGAPPMTQMLMMQIHHMRMAKHHRMMAQQCGQRNQGIIKQRCRAMRKCGVTQEHIKAWRQQMKEWKKANKSCCEPKSEEKESTSEEDGEKDEAMA